MAKRSQAPKNYYTASEAIKKLGMPRATFFDLAKKGRIKKVTPPGYKEGYYPKALIDKMVLERELFALQYLVDSSIFRKAREEDIQAIHDLSISIFGPTTAPSYENRLAPFKKNPDIYYVVEQDGIIVGYLGLIPLKKNIIDRVMGETETAKLNLLSSTSEIITPENIEMFEPGEAKNIFLVAVVRQGLSRSKYYGMRLISGGYDVLRDFAKKGVIAEGFYATSRTPDGINLSKDLGFEEIIIPGNPVRRFKLNIMATTSPFLSEYQQIARAANIDKEVS